MYVGGVAIFISQILMDYDAQTTPMYIGYKQYKNKDKKFSEHTQNVSGQSGRKLKRKEGMERMKISLLLVILLTPKCVFV